MAITIWGRPNSINVQKVMWVVGELQLDHDRIDTGGTFGGLDEPAFVAMNPNGKIPTIKDGDTVVWESNAIVRYLAARYGDEQFCPPEPARRAQAEMWMDWQVSVLWPAMVPVFWGLVRTPEPERDHAAIEAGIEACNQAFTVLDGWLAERTYLLGDHLSMGDVPIGAVTYRWYALPVAHRDLPHLKAWYERLAERPAFRQHVMLPLT